MEREWEVKEDLSPLLLFVPSFVPPGTHFPVLGAGSYLVGFYEFRG